MKDQLVIQFSSAAPVGIARYIPFLDMSMWIRRLAHSPFSHADFVLDSGDLLGASDSPDAPICLTNPPGNPRGVAVRPPEYQPFKIRRRVVIETDKAERILELAMAELGKPFDHEAIKFGTFLSDKFDNRDWRCSDFWYCMEMVISCCERGSLFPWQLVGIKNRITPSDGLLILNPFFDVARFWQPVSGLRLGRMET